MIKKINVIEKDIVEGQSGCGLSCAIALAVRRKFKTNDVQVYVDYEDEDNDKYSTFITVKDKKFIVNDPNVYFFIDDFDYGFDVKPIEFYIEETQHWHNLGVQSGRT